MCIILNVSIKIEMSNLCSAIKKDGKPCAFKRAEGLTTCRRHVKPEGKEEEIKCNACSKVFARKENLEKHIKNNECVKSISIVAVIRPNRKVKVVKEKEFRCEVCDKLFASKQSLLRHKEKKCIHEWEEKQDSKEDKISILNKLRSNTQLILAKSEKDLIPFNYDFTDNLCASLTKNFTANPAINLGSLFKKHLHNHFIPAEDKYSYKLNIDGTIVTQRIDSIICGLFMMVLDKLENMKKEAGDKLDYFYKKYPKGNFPIKKKTEYICKDGTVELLLYQKCITDYSEIRKIKDIIESIVKLGKFSVDVFTSPKQIKYDDSDIGFIPVNSSFKLTDLDPFRFHKQISQCIIEEEIPSLEELNNETVSTFNEVETYNKSGKQRIKQTALQIKRAQLNDRNNALKKELFTLNKYKEHLLVSKDNLLRTKCLLSYNETKKLKMVDSDIKYYDDSISEANYNIKNVYDEMEEIRNIISKILS